jgi:glycerol-1-phosphate dehydrogenase [NAD(P)+]
MGSREIATPRLLHMSDDCLGSVPALLAEHEFDLRRVFVGTGSGATREVALQVAGHLRDAGHEVTERDGLAGQLEQAGELAGEIVKGEVSLVLGVGGGRVIDTAKLAAGRTGIEFVSIPTAISHDGISSPIASLSHDDGVRRSHASTMPAGIIVDTQIIRAAPERMIRAGIGDLASNLTAALDWRLADRRGHDRYDAFSAIIAESAARPVVEIEDIADPEAREWIAKGLLLSGLAMAAAGTSRPCSGAEHLISHSLDARLGERAALHGEQVALGCLVSAAAHGSELLETLRSTFTRLGLPTRPGDLGIGEDEFVEAVHTAPQTRPGRYTILSELDREIPQVVDQAFSADSPVEP